MEFAIVEYVVLFILVGFAGFVDSIAGGGGLITIPTYIALGVPAELILGTNKCVSTTGGTLAVWRYLHNGSIHIKLMIFGIITGFIGSAIGARLSSLLDSRKMIYLLVVLVPLIMALNYFKLRFQSNQHQSLSWRAMVLRCSLIGLLIGGYDGFFGPGTGTFLIIAFVFFLNMNLVTASPNARIINFTSNLSAFVYFMYDGRIAWNIVAVAIVASMLGNYLGSGFVIKGNDKAVKRVFNGVLVLLLVKSIYDITGGPSF